MAITDDADGVHRCSPNCPTCFNKRGRPERGDKQTGQHHVPVKGRRGETGSKGGDPRDGDRKKGRR